VTLPGATGIGRFFVTGVCTICCLAAPAVAQFGGGGSLGGSFASRGISRPLGGIQPPRAPGLNHRGQFPQRGFGNGFLPYGYSVYVPDYFDNYVDPSYAPMVVPPAPPLPPQAFSQQAPPAPPVIINQYFVQGGPGVPVNGPAGGTAGYPPPPPSQDQDAAAGDPLAPTENYYLIAYKNHSVYAALAYWVEGNTLHYVTTQNTHNQASLDLIDIDLTKNMNRTRNVPFTVPGK
jgi:hypothetical protein